MRIDVKKSHTNYVDDSLPLPSPSPTFAYYATAYSTNTDNINNINKTNGFSSGDFNDDDDTAIHLYPFHSTSSQLQLPISPSISTFSMSQSNLSCCPPPSSCSSLSDCRSLRSSSSVLSSNRIKDKVKGLLSVHSRH